MTKQQLTQLSIISLTALMIDVEDKLIQNLEDVSVEALADIRHSKQLLEEEVHKRGLSYSALLSRI